MRIVKNTLDNKGDIEVYIFADIHIGSPKCDAKLLIDRIKLVQDDPDAYCILVGDICNNSIRTSVGDVFEEALTPMQQINTAVKMFRPIKDKILGVVAGNHENRSYKDAGVDLTLFFCNELGITDKYDNAGVAMFIKFGTGNRHYHSNTGKVVYSLYMSHGSGGGRTVGAKANSVKRKEEIIDTDIIVGAHVHEPMVFKEAYFHADTRVGAVTRCERTYVIASSFLNYENYAEQVGLRPSSKDWPVIHLCGSYKKVKVEV